MELVKIKANDEFRWGAEQQRAFEEIKKYLSKPPVLVPPLQDKPFYLSVGDTSIASVTTRNLSFYDKPNLSCKVRNWS
jgi:hypothetical protein